MDQFIQKLLAVFIFIGPTVYGLRCYECNLECRSGNATEGCKFFNETDVIQNEEDANNTSSKPSVRVPCDTPAEKEGCVACMKVYSSNRRFSEMGNFAVTHVISKVCAKPESPYTDDTCDKSGPDWAQNVVCFCYSDLCNSAISLRTGMVPLVGLILYHFL